jgi:hypothetical protein
MEYDYVKISIWLMIVDSINVRLPPTFEIQIIISIGLGKYYFLNNNFLKINDL